MKERFLCIMSFILIGCSTLFAQDKGYKMGWYGPCNQHPVVKENKQLASGAKWVRGSDFLPTVKNSSYREKSKLYYGIGLSVEMAEGDLLNYFFCLTISATDFNHLSIYKNSPLLIKLSNGQVIRLECYEDAIDEIGQLVSLRFNITKYVASAKYKISSEEIDQFKDGIAKIRFEANAEKWDVYFYRHKNDELGDFLFKEKDLITETIKSQTDFEEGF